ncbi:hypothetical protein [Salinispora tropica]|uniref:hypothetical protein n=1 Tax=Salinispora tropica TaxID=168695 RepID=UPI0004B3DBC3|nr:hypothetical protein [Salinispora tropica]
MTVARTGPARATPYRLTLTGSAALRSGATVRAEATYPVHVSAIEPASPALRHR